MTKFQYGADDGSGDTGVLDVPPGYQPPDRLEIPDVSGTPMEFVLEGPVDEDD